ncbi:hypothetical protein EMIHUDRAFT_194724 [Emiliania huxleyi CCMP1516]|uniref:BolA-like protein n=2 Tax=Emiliania huxleyi TaxID=2903 RepID=A0A0D3IZ80_EMIH1|nr:hypothetical protein EMIHUDRAFT_244936 [Emiliania huxleyi CCMP1516]XP_005794468.1 hypothetical protein EMIHUDRAFT_194724 [Emiliania huxleyi CCMP1516]EOD16565.1 hypothetical protein EMIHUDRAFT_244936 [Emiliania huxleyi CCMP1516]EOD42039.1 hypothetical protein EMIHUDRAFT_194724 [Emiliania huxleyi CCMP1516]|eukprot:XP_005768994.1 hypothetical protein EMIHUDRAFT_244936 [Emiliania huxleyi CCMP1516]
MATHGHVEDAHEHDHAGRPCTAGHSHDSHELHGAGEHAHGGSDTATSGIAGQMKAKLYESELAPSYVSVEAHGDGCGQKVQCVVVAGAFDGVALLERHRAVQDLLAEEIKEIHAFQASTPASTASSLTAAALSAWHGVMLVAFLTA